MHSGTGHSYEERRVSAPEALLVGIKEWHPGPPMELKKVWHKQARAKQKQEFLRNPDDPVITPMNRLIDLWNWY